MYELNTYFSYIKLLQISKQVHVVRGKSLAGSANCSMSYEKTHSAGRAVVRMGFACLVVSMVVFGLQRDYIQVPVTDAAFRDQ